MALKYKINNHTEFLVSHSFVWEFAHVETQ